MTMRHLFCITAAMAVCILNSAFSASGALALVETFDQQVRGTRMLALHSGAWSVEPKYSQATNALGRYGLDTNIFLNSFDPALWTTSGAAVAEYRACHLLGTGPAAFESIAAYGTGQWEFVVNWTDQASDGDGGIFLRSVDGAEAVGWSVSGLQTRAFCRSGAISNASPWIDATQMTRIKACIAFDWRPDRVRVFNGEGVMAEFTNGVPQQPLRAIVRGSLGPAGTTCTLYRVAYGQAVRPYALDYHVYFNGRPAPGNVESVNPVLWELEAGDSACPMPWNYSNNTRYQRFTSSPTIARIPRHGPYGPGTEYAVMAAQYRLNALAHGFIGLAADEYRVAMSNRVGFLNQGGTLYAYSSGPAGVSEQTALGSAWSSYAVDVSAWSSYAVDVWADFTMDWGSNAIDFYVDGVLLASHTNQAARPDPATLTPTFESRAWPAPGLAGLRFCRTLDESRTIMAEPLDRCYGKYWTVVQDDFESNVYNGAGAWTGYVPNKPDGIPEIYAEITPVTDSIRSNALMFKTRSAGGSYENGHRDLLGLGRRGNVTPFGAAPIAFVRFYFKVDRHWTFHNTGVTTDPLTTWQDGNKYMRHGLILAQQAYVLQVVLGNPRTREITFGIGDPQYAHLVRGMRVYGHTQAIVAQGDACAVYPDPDSSASWVPGALDLLRAHYPNRKAPGTPLLKGSWQEGHEEHRVNMADFNLYWHGSFYGTGDVATTVLCDETQMNGGAMHGGYVPLLRDVWYYLELEVRSTIGSSNGIGLYLGRADDPTADDTYYAPDLYFTASESTRTNAAHFYFGEDRVNGGRDKWSGIEIGPLWNQFQYMKGVYLSDLVISKSKVGNTWAASIGTPTWDTAASVTISNSPARLDYRDRTVTLQLNCPGATEMIIHHTRLPAGISRWTNYATTATWTLPYACGPVAVYATFRNGSGLATTAVSARTYLDIPPTLYSNVHTNQVALLTPAGPVSSGPLDVHWLTENIVDDEPVHDIALEAYYTGAWTQIVTGLSNVGTHTWLVPALAVADPNGRLRMIIGDAFGHSVTGTTATFSILPEPSLCVLWCAAGLHLCRRTAMRGVGR
jgi:hypothetical protein